MGTITYGVYLIYDTTEPTEAYDPAAHTEGTDYVKFTNKVTVAHNISPEPGDMDLPGGSGYAVNLGTFAETLTITDKRTRTEYDTLLQFFKDKTQVPESSYLYVLICTADSTGMHFYQNSATASHVLPCVLKGLSSSWNEQDQHWNITINVKAVWP